MFVLCFTCHCYDSTYRYIYGGSLLISKLLCFSCQQFPACRRHLNTIRTSSTRLTWICFPSLTTEHSFRIPSERSFVTFCLKSDISDIIQLFLFMLYTYFYLERNLILSVLYLIREYYNLVSITDVLVEICCINVPSKNLSVWYQVLANSSTI